MGYVDSVAKVDSQVKLSDSKKKPKPVAQDSKLLGYLEKAHPKISYKDVKISWSKDVSKYCGKGVDITGCYSQDEYTDGTVDNRAIHVEHKHPKKDLTRLLAHEYLHYVWYKKDLGSNQKLTSNLTKFYKENVPFQTRLSQYESAKKLKTTELFSYACTEIDDLRLGAYISKECNKYIDTSTLTALY